jgi:hypothetical protein
MLAVDQPVLKICRMCVSRREGDVSILDFRYLIATSEGIRQAEEVHRLALVSPEQMTSYFHAAGLRCTFDPVGLSGRGLFVARPADQ